MSKAIKINGERYSENLVAALKLLNKEGVTLEYFSGFGNKINPSYFILGVPNPKEGTHITTVTGNALRNKGLITLDKSVWARKYYTLSSRGKKIIEELNKK